MTIILENLTAKKCKTTVDKIVETKDLTLLTKSLEDQQTLLNEIDEVLTKVYDLVVDASIIMSEEDMDDNLGISNIKSTLGVVLAKITKWQETQSAKTNQQSKKPTKKPLGIVNAA